MKYALLTDNSVQWFTYLVEILNTGEAANYHQINNSLNNEYLSNLFNRQINFNNLRLVIPGQSCDTWYGNWISQYEYDRIRKMILLFPSVEEYYRLGKLEKL